ncbi:MAG TPA: BPSS1780 family membrane protein [Burkholderiales bacterium]|nr:BPSS1780 family membrane protein [Burkholderiales bacterium]
MSTNPYAAPRAQVADETIDLRGDFLPAGRKVPTGNGWTWISAAWSIFRAKAGLWIATAVVLSVIYLALFVAYTLFPFVGAILFTLLSPVYAAGLVIMSRAIDRGGDARFNQLFAGFTHRLGALLTVGIVYFIANLVIGVGVFWLLGADMSMSAIPADPTAALMLTSKVAVAGLIVMALMLPVVMAVWFAPALIALHEMAPIEAMKHSFSGGLKNMLPFLLYGIVLLVASVIASIPALLGWLVLGPVIGASIYTSYRDIYFTEPAA